MNRLHDAAPSASDRRLRELIENSSDLIFTIDAAGIVTFVSPSVMRLTGYAQDEVLGRQLTDFSHADDAEKMHSTIGALLEHPGHNCTCTSRWRTKTGEFRIFEAIGKNALDNPDLQSIVINARDITEREQAADELRRSEGRFRAVVEQVMSAVFVIQDSRVVYANRRTRKIFGYAEDDPINPDLLSHVVESERPRMAEQIRLRMMGKGTPTHSVHARRRDNSEFILGLSATVADYQGAPALFSSAQDITERANAEEQIRQYTTRLEQAINSTIDVISIIGELRDPYTSGHQRRVANLARAMAMELRLPAEQVDGIHVAGHLHDAGKISVPAEILSIPRRLSDPEYSLVKMHADTGYDILKRVQFSWPVAEAVRQHHERMDGSGYPRGLSGDKIVLGGRILAVADTVEAMASHRPYRAALGIDLALAEISGKSGTHYDPALVDACAHLFRKQGYALAA